MLTPQEAQIGVARGAAHLDIHRPGWASRIDVGTLTLWDPCGCIVGQLFGVGFTRGLIALGLHSDFGTTDAGLHGFAMVGEDDFGGEDDYSPWSILQACWIDAIADRLHPVTETPQPVEDRCGSLAG